jgi:hypothetical protein
LGSFFLVASGDVLQGLKPHSGVSVVQGVLVQSSQQEIALKLVKFVLQTQVGRDQSLFDLQVKQISNLDQLILENSRHKKAEKLLLIDFVVRGKSRAH